MPSILREPERQKEIIWSVYRNGTESEKLTLDRMLGMTDVSTEIKDWIQTIRACIAGSSIKAIRIPGTFHKPEKN